jgi:hypothetical protein
MNSPGRLRSFVGRVNDRPPAPYVEVEAPDWLSPLQARRLAARLLVEADRADRKMAEHERKQVRKRLPKGDVASEEPA